MLEYRKKYRSWKWLRWMRKEYNLEKWQIEDFKKSGFLVIKGLPHIRPKPISTPMFDKLNGEWFNVGSEMSISDLKKSIRGKDPDV